ncbi:META domain-containing protein [Pontixanthobacter sp.]|uniref:META domain-containing protein n=1 Tax=Pontixanthobacter sp. TaxID=2792078 RepID=UPI003C7DE190
MDFAALALIACDQSAPNDNSNTLRQGQRATAPTIDELTGRWRVVAIDGFPIPETAGVSQAHIAIGPDSLGGYIGCNSFGGFALYADGRFAISNWGGTLMACQSLKQQEQALSDLFFANPKVRARSGRLVILSRDHVLELADRVELGPNAGSPDPMRVPVAENVSQLLAGTRWRIQRLDENNIATEAGNGEISFTGRTWTARAGCAILNGSYIPTKGRLSVSEDIAQTLHHCEGEGAQLDLSLETLLRADPHYLVGPNGELIMAGGGQVLVGTRQR